MFAGTYREQAGASFGIARNTLAPGPDGYVAPWARSSVPGYAEGGNKFDLDGWDRAYLERLKDFLTYARKLDVIVELTFFSSHYEERHWKLSPFKPANNVNATSEIEWNKLHTIDNGNILDRQEKLVRMLVRELNAFDNVYFEIQNEPWSDHPRTVSILNPYLTGPGRDKWPNSVDVADNASLAWQARVATWIRAEEAALPKRHLVAQNYANFVASLSEVDPNVSVLNFHYAYPEAALLNRGWNRPISYDESGFLGGSDDVYRREAWRFIMAGGAGFSGLDYSFTVGHEDGTDLEKNGPGGGSPAFRKQLSILRQFLGDLDFTRMEPDGNFVRQAPGLDCMTLSRRGEQYAVYCNGKAVGSIGIDLPAGDFAATAVDTRTGERRSLTSGKTLTLPAFEGDIAISIRRSSSK